MNFLNYIGSKRTLSDFILTSINSVCSLNTNTVFCDLFAGTGTVGSMFKKQGCFVIANDMQYYSYVLNKHFIENIEPLSVPSSVLSCLGNAVDDNGFIYNNYCPGSGSGRMYFTDYNGKKCDSIRNELDKIRGHQIDDSQYYWLLASLIESIDKRANTASVYGAFLKSFKKSALNNLELELLPVIDGQKGVVYNDKAEHLIHNISGDILYLDPPYNTRQYCSYYHLLETIARNDNPVIHGKTGLRDYSTQTSSFCSVKTAADSLDYILKNSDFKYIFLSYNNEGLIQMDDIKQIMCKYGKYELFATGYSRFKADRNRAYIADKTTEYLHCCIR